MNPDWEPSENSCSRKDQPEWIPVGLVGKLLVRDDGTCKVGGYCKPNHEGIATASPIGYRVMKRTGKNQLLVLVDSALRL
ncbi:peptidase G2 autoproteolytic cleavage domain-containing protein [Halalkalibacterium halodurans]|uniref:peptidase G2 autoproteolytic cleavage domain-containing protein n=1 Tax=Halalkalibacterium halodurans TaxID=86665 RepID=UPI00399D2424